MIRYILIAISLVLFACSDNTYFDAELNIPESNWDAKKAAIFDFDITDSLQIVNLYIKITNTEDYRYSNLWLLVKTYSSQGDIAYDTLQYLLADEKGKWLGNKKNNTYLNNFVYKSNVRFPKNGKYSVEIIQLMRDINLKGIKKVGFRIKKVNK